MNLSRSEKWFTFFAMLCACLICGEYGITRPTSNSLFLTLFSSQSYPWVWLATVPINLLAVYLYNRFLPLIGPLRMLISFALLTIFINTLSGIYYSYFPQLIFFQYAWKDIYVLLMLKQLWSMIHGTIPAKRANYLYGCIYGMGTVGAVGGSLIPSLFAVSLGSERILFFTLPIYLLLIFVYKTAFDLSGIQQSTFSQDLTPNPSPSEALSLIRRSPLLIGALILVVLMQVSTALMEYQFNAHLELNILEKDLRTAYCGRLGGYVNLLSLGFQFVGSFLMIRFLGVRKSHLFIPLLLGSSALFSRLVPGFGILSGSYVLIKAVDFSLFGVIREMLYVPLRLDEKFRAKAIIDVFAHRTSKALISFGLLALQAIAGTYLLSITSLFSLIIFFVWIAVVLLLFRKGSEANYFAFETK